MGRLGNVHAGRPPRGRGRGRGRGGFNRSNSRAGAKRDAPTFESLENWDELDASFGYPLVDQGVSRDAWLVSMQPTTRRPDGLAAPALGDAPAAAEGVPPSASAGERAGVDFYFIDDANDSFKVTVYYPPYFYIMCRPRTETLVEEWLAKRFEGLLVSTERVWREDLKLVNHLVGHQRLLVKLTFNNVQDLLTVRRELLPLAQKTASKREAVDTYADALFSRHNGGSKGEAGASGGAALAIEMDDSAQETSFANDKWTGGSARNAKLAHHDDATSRGISPEEAIVEVREYDVPYYLRVAMDNDIRVGLWYHLDFAEGEVTLTHLPERVARAEPCVLAFDIETEKAPLKFPDAEHDRIMMISYMVDGQGFLITNREIVSEDIEDFEYTPKEEFEGPFMIFNEPNEHALLDRFFSHFRDVRPRVVATYNGDSFDFPYVEARAAKNGLSMLTEMGFCKDTNDEYKSRGCVHMDCFRWVKRDSYLPQGSQGLKAVTVAKLGYDPVELDPELMTPYASEFPQLLAQYSVSDAVATYYLYMKYVHPFIFSLCNIIPLNPDEVLRKGTGTLCETLLMVQAYKANILMPNRHVDPVGNEYRGHLLESETYVGGHVEALEAGVFRADIPTDFKVNPATAQQLIDDLDLALKFSIEVEGNLSMDDVTNYDEVKAEITAALEELRDNPLRKDCPLIYHLDVAAMYPNIMLSNRLQPDAVVTEAECATCDYNRGDMTCDRKMNWAWRGEYFPAKRDEVNMIKHALTQEKFPSKFKGGPRRDYWDLSPAERDALLHKRLADYSRKVYGKAHETTTVVREAIICQRENPFYTNTVRDFRDRRYEYKGLHKQWKGNLSQAASLAEKVDAGKMIVLYDSLQLAHKCILNSFYGYVMRKGARWFSMEMGGITCLTGATIIQLAKELVDNIGRPLELDTDGIWCMLPGKFPENFKFTTKTGKKLMISYPCTMLNHLVHRKFTNHQYHTLDQESGTYSVKSENSIFFELDGPYRAMMLPSSKEEGKLLKKRYAVFEFDGSLAELKGFELKRRGELQLIKDFQKQLFETFLHGDTLEKCYAAVARVADQWLDVLFSRGSTLEDSELIDLIAENKSMSKTLAEYEGQKSSAITTARRLAEFLGKQMVKDKGLACKFIISQRPLGAPVTERAVPVAIFSAPHEQKQFYLRKFLKDNSLTDLDLRSVLDWDYYIERFGGVIQKLITIPAAMQRVANPVPRIRHPDWLYRRVAQQGDKYKQNTITDLFAKASLAPPPPSAPAEEGNIFRNPPIATKANLAPTVESEEVDEEVEKRIPSPLTDFKGYINAVRGRWKQHRAAIRELAKHGASALAHANSSRGTLGGLIAQHTTNLATADWDVVSLAATGRAGEFKLFICIDGRVHALRLRVPRTFYLDWKSVPQEWFERHSVPDGLLLEPISRTLPRGCPSRHLYRVTVPEETFVREEAFFSGLLNHPSVNSVYEMQVPLDVRAMLRLGTRCHLDPMKQGQLAAALDLGFELGDLLPSPTSGPYLSQAKWGVYYLYHAGTEQRHFIALISPTGKAAVHLVDSAGLRQVPRVENMYRQAVESQTPLEGVFSYPDALEVGVHVHRTERPALRAIGATLASWQRSETRPCILSVCSSRPLGHYDATLGSHGTVPMVSVPQPSGSDDLPALNWQASCVKRMLSNYLRLSPWLSSWMQLASEYAVPVGNLPRDHALFGADMALARALLTQDNVLWWSPTPAPDLGGHEADTNVAVSWDDAGEELRVSKPGAYSTVVLELSLGDVALDAVLQSASVNEMEGSGPGSMAFGAQAPNLDDWATGTNGGASYHQAMAALGDAVLTPNVFATVKGLVRAWHSSRSSRGSAHLANNFWRWVSSEQSALYEPALQRFLQGLMRKTLLQLLAELKRLGAEVVYASFNRLLLRTGKTDASSAAAYGTYLTSAVTAQDLFRYLRLDLVHAWELLLWMDTANYGGVLGDEGYAQAVAKRKRLAASSEEDSTTEDEGPPTPGRAAGDNFTIESAWNIQTYLPPALQDDFARLAGRLMYRLYKVQRTLQADEMIAPMVRVPPPLGPGADAEVEKEAREQVAASALTLEGKRTKAVQDLVRHAATRWLLQVVSEVQTAQSTALPTQEAEWEFPDRPGGGLKGTSTAAGSTEPKPALELVKAFCAVLGLVSEAGAEVAVCKRQALELLGVNEFSSEAAWTNPARPCRVAHVICAFCQSERTLDLVRDADLDGDVWRCERCHCPYDRAQLEAKLVRRAYALLTRFTLQDVRCNKCGTERATQLQPRCECSGEWGLTLGRLDVRQQFRLLDDVARTHNLTNLREAVDGLLVLV